MIERILAHQRELAIPVETKKLRVLRMIVTSFVILIALAFYKPLAAHAAPIVNLLVEIVLGAGAAYLVSQVWPYVRWVPGPLQLFVGGIFVVVLITLYTAVAVMMTPSKPGVRRLSISEFIARAKRGDLSRIKTKGLPVKGDGWSFPLNEGEETYLKATLEEAKVACEKEGLRVPATKEEILALDPRPRAARTLTLWTLEGRAYQYVGSPNETLNVFSSGPPGTTHYVLCLR